MSKMVCKIYIFTTSVKLVNVQSYVVLGHYSITILYKVK